MIDIHAHILPELDDGARSMDEALEMARIARDDGIEIMTATPHAFNGMFETPSSGDIVRRVAAHLRAGGNAVAYGLREAGVGRQFKDANALGAGRVVVIGPDETAAGEAVVRAMDTGEETRVPLAELTGEVT